jgi:hypothetical protein
MHATRHRTGSVTLCLQHFQVSAPHEADVHAAGTLRTAGASQSRNSILDPSGIGMAAHAASTKQFPRPAHVVAITSTHIISPGVLSACMLCTRNHKKRCRDSLCRACSLALTHTKSHWSTILDQQPSMTKPQLCTNDPTHSPSHSARQEFQLHNRSTLYPSDSCYISITDNWQLL